MRVLGRAWSEDEEGADGRDMRGRRKVMQEARELMRDRGIQTRVWECGPTHVGAQTSNEDGPGQVEMLLKGIPGGNYDEEYAVLVQVGQDYPRETPRVRFLHHLHHALVSDLGLVPAEVFEAFGRERDGNYSLVKIVDACQAILEEREDIVPFPCTRRMRMLALNYADTNRLRLQWIKHLRENSRHPELYQRFPQLQPSWFDPVTFSAVQSGQKEAILRTMRQECPGVYSFSLLSERFCRLLCEDINTIPGARRPPGMMLRPPSTMQAEGIVLDDVGMEPLLMAMLEQILQKVSGALYGDQGKPIVAHHGFILHNGPSNCTGIPSHKDEGDLTFNVCITPRFKGGEMCFYTPQSGDSSTFEEKIVEPVIGRCIVYPGGVQHATRQTRSGVRRSFVLWCFYGDHDAEAPLTEVCPLQAFRVSVEDGQRAIREPLSARHRRFEPDAMSDTNSCADETTGMD